MPKNKAYRIIRGMELAAYVDPATVEKEGIKDHQVIFTENTELVANHDNQTLAINIFQRIWFILDVMLMTFPLWCAGNAAVTRKGGLVEVIYLPPRDYTINTDSFIQRVIWYSAKVGDHFARHARVEQIDVWASGILDVEEDGQVRVWKGLNFTIKTNLP